MAYCGEDTAGTPGRERLPSRVRWEVKRHGATRQLTRCRSGPADLSELTSPAWSLRDSWVLDCFTAFAMTTEEPTGWV